MGDQTTLRGRFGVARYANVDGFLTIHGMLSSEADFADIISANLCNPPYTIAEALTTAETPFIDPDDAEHTRRNREKALRVSQAMKAKQAFVEGYYRRAVGVRLSEMQLRSIKRMTSYIQIHHADK